jgi:hypothetical protein
MLKHRVRNLAATGITIVSAAALIALGATGASAAAVVAANPGHADMAANTLVPAIPVSPAIPSSTSPRCYGGVPWTCLQIFGNGLYVAQENGWAHNPTAAQIDYLHIELYNATSDAGPSQAIAYQNCGQFNLPGGANSSDCSTGSYTLSYALYECDALWQWLGGHSYKDLGYECILVHS